MGWLTFYQCLINRQYDEIGRFRKIVDENYFVHCLMNAARTAYMNGMDVQELKKVIERYLGAQQAQRFENLCKQHRVHA